MARSVLRSPTAALFVAMALATYVGCGGGKDSTFEEDDGPNDDPGGSSGGPGGGLGGGGGADGGGVNAVQVIESARIEPADAARTIARGAQVTQPFRVLAIMRGRPGAEVDITARSVFYVPDNYLVGGFPLDGASTFTSRLPSTASPSPQRGGRVTVQAKAANTDGSITEITTSFTVLLESPAVTPPTGAPEASPALPAQPGTRFIGAAAPERAPQIVYPNPGVLLPPNLKRLDVQWRRGAADNDLFEVSFVSAGATISYYTRCSSTPTGFVTGDLESTACAFALRGDLYDTLAESNRGTGTLTLRVRGANEASGAFGASASQTLEFAENRVDGAVYYWNASSPPSIDRFDFGSGEGTPQIFQRTGEDGVSNNHGCVGCHALSRDGTKMMSSTGNSSQGQLVYMNDVANKTLASGMTGATTGASNDNRVLVGSFSPDGASFVAAPPRNSGGDERVYFHDGTTGARSFSYDLGFKVSHPEWSPDGKKIAVTRIGGTNSSSIEFQRGGISMLTTATSFTSTLTPTVVDIIAPETGVSSYNPTFLPDSSFLLFSRTDCEGGAGCNGYADAKAKTWAIAPTAGATAIPLTKSAEPGPNDGVNTELMDTFPRATPFKTVHRGGTLMWFTISSQRRAGMRTRYLNTSAVGDPATQTLLWMFAVDPAKLALGQDGSYAGFYLPFQNMRTSNHMASWAERLVGESTQPAPPPAPPPPPPPPAPPPVK